MFKNIAIIGSGGWGTAVAVHLSQKGHKVRLWSYFKSESEKLSLTRENSDFLPGIIIPKEIEFYHDMEKCVCDADVIIIATPSHAVRRSVATLKEFYKPSQIILNISKGLEEKSFMRLSQVIESEIPNATIAVMSGPSHAEEVARGVPTANVVASKSRKVAEYLQDIFMSPKFRAYTNPDILGVEMGGSLKNVIALCAGITDGLGFGDNTKAALMTRGIAEISRLGTVMGGRRETFFGLTGIGDLIVTCTSMHSRNRRAGILIGQGKSVDETLAEIKMVVEGVKTSYAAYHLASLHSVDMPIVNEAYRILYENKNPLKAVSDLMMRSKKHESEDVAADCDDW